jgi:hypothetical protein
MPHNVENEITDLSNILFDTNLTIAGQQSEPFVTTHLDSLKSSLTCGRTKRMKFCFVSFETHKSSATD